MKYQYQLKQFNEDLDGGAYTSLGCYPKYFVTSDGDSLSFESAKKESKLIRQAILDEDESGGWRVIACDVNWESFLYCCHSNKQIESAYHPINEQ